MSGNSQNNNGQSPPTQPETSVQSQEEEESTAQSQAQGEPSPAPTGQQAQQLGSGAPNSQTVGAGHNPPDGRMWLPVQVTAPSNLPSDLFAQTIQETVDQAIAQAEAAGASPDFAGGLSVRMRAVFDRATGTISVSAVIDEDDADTLWDQCYQPEYDIYPYDITAVPTAQWPADEEDPFQNPAIARVLYRAFSEVGPFGEVP